MTTKIPAESMKKTIAYLYLLSFYTPEGVTDVKRNTSSLLKRMAAVTGMKENEYLEKSLPEACHRIVSFHQASREPDSEMVKALLETAHKAAKDVETLRAFKTLMEKLSTLPGRSKPENRLHRNKGCRLCAAPCRFGFFTLVSDPDFSRLQELIKAESDKPADVKSPLTPMYLFTADHLTLLTGNKRGAYERSNLANLAFCLLMLAMAKSRMAFPEAQVRLFQQTNQEFIRQQPTR